jgi:phytanoyl-CoA hydroxylase
MTVSGPPKVDLDFFQEQGYLVVNDVFDQQLDIQPVVQEYMTLLDSMVEKWVREGTITSAYADLPFPERLARILSETGPAGFSPFDISLPFTGVTAETPMHVGPAVFNLLTSPRLLDVVEQFIGPEILSNPIQHVRIKPPEHLLPSTFGPSLVTRSDWHQDQGVALPEVDETEMLTVWVAINDATVENGCLCVVPGSHTGGLATHCPGVGERKGLHIPDELRGEHVVPVPVRSGGVLFLHRRTMHASLTNTSDGIRWSFDLRYQPIGQPTGRPWFPAFVARSRQNPDSAVTDWRVWADLWAQTRLRLTENPPEGKFNRWDGSEPVCA